MLQINRGTNLNHIYKIWFQSRIIRNLGQICNGEFFGCNHICIFASQLFYPSFSSFSNKCYLFLSLAVKTVGEWKRIIFEQYWLLEKNKRGRVLHFFSPITVFVWIIFFTSKKTRLIGDIQTIEITTTFFCCTLSKNILNSYFLQVNWSRL